MMVSLSVLFDLPGMSLDQVEVHAETITIEAHLELPEAACPLCQVLAQRVHSHYTRTMHDVPCGRKALRLIVQVRRFSATTRTARARSSRSGLLA